MAPSKKDSKTSDPGPLKLNGPRIRDAISAMEVLEIPEDVVRPVLKRLWKLYEGEWKLIEDDNYRALADAIFELDEKKGKAITLQDKQEPPSEIKQISAPKRLLNSSASSQRNQITQKNRRQYRQLDDDDDDDTDHSNSVNLSANDKKLLQISDITKGREKSKVSLRNEIGKQEPPFDKQEPPSPKRLLISSASSQRNQITQKKRRQYRQLDDDETYHSNSVNSSANDKKLLQISDITKGREKIEVSLRNEIGIELPKFVYITQNTTFQNAYVPFSLARISDEDCCKKCSGDCLSSRVLPCACSRETGGEFAYTPEGLLKDKFLEACISNYREPQNQNLFYCQNCCPLEKAKNVHNPDPCKGHPLKKFIKECWSKCGCTMACGNRVVQRGLTCKLQVVATKEKGWAIRTLEYLPKELHERNEQRKKKNEQHTYPVLLDNDWGSEQVLKDEEALCLDATDYGNVARFLNHRCFDSNLIDIPVEVETPDHHYYHIAFFTTRNVEADEELTW
nr:histone-lysine N-methyltransferase SUVR4 [Tanacetum cinerariifolium]